MIHKKKYWKIAFIIYMIIIAFISLSAYLKIIPSEIRRIPHYDILMHFFLLGMASFFSCKAFNDVRIKKTFIPPGPFIVAIIAITDELIQIYFPARSFSFLDFFANLTGIIVFCLLARIKTGKIKSVLF
jgi:VanZ family protein